MKQLVEFLINSRSTGVIKDNDFVDLGLSVLWAKCNIGAKEETDYGHYYQWGGLEPMEDKECDWKSAPFNNGEKDFDKEYFYSITQTVCPNPKCILIKEYDIAYNTYKGKVHMPSKDNCYDLINKTQNVWVDNYNNSGINGRLFTAENDNSIFIPAAGLHYDSYTHDIGYDAGIWSSSLETYFCISAICLRNKRKKIETDGLLTYVGIPVRAVKEK